MSGQPFAIDHLMMRVPDSEAAGRVFEALGFAVTPRSLLPGMSNRLVCFAPQDARGASFIELIAVDDAALAPPSVLEMLGAAMGPAAIVVATADAHALAHDLAGKAAISAPLDLARECDLGAGVVQLAFSVVVARRAGAPVGWSAIQHKTPQHYRVQQFINHPAGDVRLQAILVMSDDPIKTATALHELWGGSFDADEAGYVCTKLAASELHIHTPDSLKQIYGYEPAGDKPSLAGIVLAAGDPERMVDALAGHAGLVTRLTKSAVQISDAGWRCLVAVE